MSLTSGTRLGPYEILSVIGAGGMGEVYKGRDTRLDRIVAIKIILAKSALNLEFRDRFEREARAISALDHPHICTLHDVGHERVEDTGSGTHHEVDYLVMQFIEGQTLADRLARASRPTSDPSVTASKPPSGDASLVSALSTVSRGPMPVETALRYAREIALALDAAHRRGIVHRDLKPGNVMLTKTGTKLLDFGLAKLAPSPVSGFEDGDTRTSLGRPASPLTGQGAILGTLHYMSPEQLEGREVDARSDIFAFGALLFEMLSGRRAFESPSHAGVIAAIVGADPPELGDLADTKTRLPIVARRGLDRLLQKCLSKDPDERWQSAADLADELTWINEERLRAVEPESAPAESAVPQVAVSGTRERVWMAATVLAVTAAVALAVWLYPRPAPPPQPISFFVGSPDGAPFASGPGLVAMSPDGQTLAFVTGAAPSQKLWIRPLHSLAATALPSGDGAWHPAWSPNGRSIAFTSSGGAGPLKRIDVAGGPALTLAEQARERPAWSSAGVILYTGQDNRLYRVPETGGPSTPVTELDKDRQENLHAWPAFLSDGRRFVYLARSTNSAKTALYLASIDSPGRTHLVDVLSMVDITPGYLVYQRDGTLMAHPFDSDAGRTTGDPMPVVEDVQFNFLHGRGAFSVSPTGALVYRTGEALGSSATLTWFDSSGKTLGTLSTPGNYRRFGALSPDGRRFVVPDSDPNSNNTDLYMIDVERGIRTRFTSDPGDDRDPVWTRDSQSVIFSSFRKGRLDLYVKPAGGTAAERPLFESSEDKHAHDVSPDGKTLLFSAGPLSARRLWTLPLSGDPKPSPVFPDATGNHYSQGRFSPDGLWIAYMYAEGPGTGNVFVQPFPPRGAIRERVSTTTGYTPAWTRDGRQLVFATLEGRFMTADVTTAGGTLRVGLARELFTQRQVGQSTTPGGFTMDAKGRFLLVVNSSGLQGEEARPTPLTVVVNWLSTLKK